MNFGENVKRYRKLAGLKQNELAERLNISIGMIGRIERGKSLPGLETANEMAKILNVPLDYFVCDESRDNLIFASVVFVEKLKNLDDLELKAVKNVLQSAFEIINSSDTD
ncbi:MAG: helix-turn-helix domain-containing protein [Oscillospiraceae bacterium]|nr:helix-turn-helix domain-containing protein [Oscillospiraceae bacterium]